MPWFFCEVRTKVSHVIYLKVSKRSSHNGTLPFISGSVADVATPVAHPLPGRCAESAVGESLSSSTKQKKEQGQEMYYER